MIALVMIISGAQGLLDKEHVPLGLLYIASSLRRNGHNVKIYHLLPNEIENAIKEIVKEQPLWIGVSVFSGMSAYYSSSFSKSIKQLLPKTPIVWGGHHPSLTAEQCLKEDFVDIVCIGEGEIASLKLTEKLELKKSLEDVKGIAYKKNGKTILNSSRELIENLDDLPLDWSLLNMDYYKKIQGKKSKTISFYSSRGCPYNCAFCSTPQYSGRTFRYHSVEYILNNFIYLKKQGIDSVYFSDDLFLGNRQRAFKILEELYKMGIRCETLDIRFNQIDEEALKHFNEYETTGIFLGWESGNDRILKLMRKGITTEYILKKAKLFEKFPEISVWASGIILVPTETREETMNTLFFSMKLRDIFPKSTVSIFRFMPLPKTDLTFLAAENGFEIPQKPEDWRVIDPLTSYYKVTWLNWFTKQDDWDFRMAQELSRNSMLDMIKGKKFGKTVKNFFVKRMRKRVNSLNFKFPIDMKVFKILLELYNYLRFGKKRFLVTQIVK